jgi:Arginyl tRNA synthetase N terminal domain
MAAAVAVLTDRDLDRSVLPAVAGVERPRNPGHGDYASNLALRVAGKAGLPPRVMAQAIAEKLTGDPAIQSVEIASSPGYGAGAAGRAGAAGGATVVAVNRRTSRQPGGRSSGSLRRSRYREVISSS